MRAERTIGEARTGKQPAEEAPAIHPLSMACFMEGVLPEALPLAANESVAVAVGLEALRKRTALEAYVLCLEHLLAGGAERC